MLSVFLQLSRSWWDVPHNAIAILAERMISEEQLDYINDVLATWNSEKDVFRDTAVWHDNLKKQGSYMSDWHFRNKPVLEKGFVGPKYVPVGYNVTTVNVDCLNTIYNKTTSSIWALGFCFRSLIHFVGDAHCPVHAAGFWGENFPTGDAGATKQKEVCQYDNYYGSDVCKNLHALWDSGCLNYRSSNNTIEWDIEFDKNMSVLWEKYPPEKVYGELAGSIDPIQWEIDTYNVSVDYVYGKFGENGTVDDEYIDAGQIKSNELISVAGYRLGKVFQHFFETRQDNIPEVGRITTTGHPSLPFR